MFNQKRKLRSISAGSKLTHSLEEYMTFYTSTRGEKWIVSATYMSYIAHTKNKLALPRVRNIKVFKNWPQGSALSVAGGIIIPRLSQRTPWGHYSRAATDAFGRQRLHYLGHTSSEKRRGERGEHTGCWSEETGMWWAVMLMRCVLGPRPALEASHLGQVLLEAGREMLNAVMNINAYFFICFLFDAYILFS